ncbi:MFS transporter [Oceanicella actignis]|uniref:Predicted arabinose efflux permease, MFS family n=1 Tax=Oceanicella actignis TaxID=1189325 RepID=A0A1M7SFU4_9RHOB|nr:MFS transporter [Oceanicella actignis]SET21916.1 Predicted arabinose efflux permease, MFS family [Oceanicella actignis]SHN57324.1 Predicted arabinose efflux permease, MFS family [Oceanicella actignis]
MRLVISFAALLMSVVLVQLGSGALGPLDALSGAALGFSTAQIGMLGSAHFVGFFVGCWAAPRMMGAIGHSRAFAAFAASGAIGALAHPLWPDPTAWAALRALTGLAVAGAYTVVESWLQAKVDNSTRGRVVGIYRVVDLSASLVAQAMIAVLPPASYVSYNIVAILCCLCLLPLTLSRAAAPAMPLAPRLRPARAARLSPLAAAGVLVAGSSMPAFRMVGPVYGHEVGLDAEGIATFLAAAILGGAAAQIPIGWVADKMDRRHVLTGLSAASAATCLGVAADGGSSAAAAFAGAFAFGLFAFPIYSVSSAHANDFAEPDFVAELNASLMFIYGLGAIASPLSASLLLDRFGPGALFSFIAGLHGLLALFGLARMAVGRKARARTPYRYLPRTSFVVGRLMRRRKDG